jgi:hypothetical protein
MGGAGGGRLGLGEDVAIRLEDGNRRERVKCEMWLGEAAGANESDGIVASIQGARLFYKGTLRKTVVDSM